MEILVSQVLLTVASLSAGYVFHRRRLVYAAIGLTAAAIYIARATTTGDAQWGLVAVLLNVGAGLYVLGYRRGVDAESHLASPT